MLEGTTINSHYNSYGRAARYGISTSHLSIVTHPAFSESWLNNALWLDCINREAELQIVIDLNMSLITISAIVKADASFAFPPYGLPTNKNISVQKTTTTGQYQITYDGVFASMPVVTVTQAWLGTPGSSGGSAYDNAVVNEITKAYTTVKVGDGNGHGQ